MLVSRIVCVTCSLMLGCVRLPHFPASLGCLGCHRRSDGKRSHDRSKDCRQRPCVRLLVQQIGCRGGQGLDHVQQICQVHLLQDSVNALGTRLFLSDPTNASERFTGLWTTPPNGNTFPRRSSTRCCAMPSCGNHHRHVATAQRPNFLPPSSEHNWYHCCVLQQSK